MKINDVIEVRVSSLNHSGDGVVKSGLFGITIPKTLPGDTVQVKINRIKEHYARGELIKVIQPSEKRVPPGCAAYDRGCGGCQLLHMNYTEQIALKNKTIKDLIRFPSKLPAVNKVHAAPKVHSAPAQVNPIIEMQTPYNCRNKMSLLNRGGRLYFMQENSDKTIMIDKCPQETKEIQKVYEKLKLFRFPDTILQVHLRSAHSAENGKTGICFFIKTMSREVNIIANKIMKEIKTVSGIGAASYRDYHTIAGMGTLEQKIGDILFKIPLNGFFQTNTIQAGVLQKIVSEQISDENPVNILDLYCGSGFFTLSAAAKAKKILGIENNADAVRSARANAALNGIKNAEFMTSDVPSALKEINPGTFQTIILDPPRAGCGPEVISELLRLKPNKIIYISCSPETLSRDLRTLIDKTFRLTYCQPLDMFPQTNHMEIVSTLELVR